MTKYEGHTPGPWNWDAKVWDYNHEQEAPWLVTKDGTFVLQGSIDCREIDARLIADAPMLLAERDTLAARVKVLEGALLQASFAIPTWHGVFEVVRAALAASTKGAK
jgi:hypothetical protein